MIIIRIFISYDVDWNKVTKLKIMDYAIMVQVVAVIENGNIRQRRWLDWYKIYDCSINSHSGKANVVTDTLCRKKRLKRIISSKKLIKEFERLKLKAQISGKRKRRIVWNSDRARIDSENLDMLTKDYGGWKGNWEAKYVEVPRNS